jgi:hypothetical protein
MKIVKTFKRYSESKKLEFIRWDFRWFGFGIFLGRGNYIKGRGIEFFTNAYRGCPFFLSPFLRWHVGYCRAYEWEKRKIFRWNWSGSVREPFHGWTLRIGAFGIGKSWTPKFIQRIAEKYRERKWEKMYYNDNGEPI